MHWITGTLNLNTFVLHQNQAKRPLINISFCNYQFTFHDFMANNVFHWPVKESFFSGSTAFMATSKLLWKCTVFILDTFPPRTVKDDLHIDATVEYLDKHMNITQSCSLQTSWFISSVIQERLPERSAFFYFESLSQHHWEDNQNHQVHEQSTCEIGGPLLSALTWRKAA